MNLETFIDQYGEWIVSYKEHENGVIRFKFSKAEKCMWLKGRVCELLDMKVKHSRVGSTHWFEPTDN